MPQEEMLLNKDLNMDHGDKALVAKGTILMCHTKNATKHGPGPKSCQLPRSKS